MKALEWLGTPLMAAAAGAFLFSANLHTDDTGIIAGLIFIFAAVVAFLFRKPGLMFGSAIGWSILASELWNHRYSVPRSQMSSAKDFVLLLAVVTVISIVGSLTGFGLRRLVAQNVARSNPR